VKWRSTGSARVTRCFNLDHTRRRLGEGEAAFAAAYDAVRAWRMFPAWTRIHPLAPIEQDAVIAVVIRVVLWWVNACRIVYVIDEPRRFGFAYGTLPERFVVEWLADDSVWYDIRAFSQPRHSAARIGYPFTRALQHRFARHSADAMLAHVLSRRSRPAS
jgi:uncharacterized protein (UPF0548 family)